MSINNKTDAINYINGDITSGVDNSSNLNPVPYSSPIKYGNFSSFWKDFINYLFPTPTTDLYGKSPIFSNTDYLGNYTATNTDYSRLKYQAIIPVGGIIMYGGAGDNTGLPIDGYLYCDGSKYDMTLTINQKYNPLFAIIGQSFHNPNNGTHGITADTNFMYLPDYRSKTPVGVDTNGTTTRYVDPSSVNGAENNTKNIGNIGGANKYAITQANLPAIPDHKHMFASDEHSLNISAVIGNGGEHDHALYILNSIGDTVVSSAGIPQDLLSRIVYSSSGVKKGFVTGGVIGSGGSYAIGGDSLIDGILAKRTHPSGLHNHTVNTSSSTLTGNTGYVVPYTKTATEINMRSAYLVTNFIIKY
jgi:hypothetical protein